MKVEELLKEVEKRYGISSQEVLDIYSTHFDSEPTEIMLLMEKIPGLSALEVFSTVDMIKNPDPSSRFVWEPNQISVYDKDGNLKSEPSDWIKFGEKWYNKRKLLTM
jgi:hypothetical protein